MFSFNEFRKALEQMRMSQPRRGPRRNRPSRKSRRGRVPGTTGGPGVTQLAPLPKRQRAPRTSPGSRGNAAAGEVRIRRRELLTEISGATGISVMLAPSKFPWLKNLAKAFERVKWISARVEYIPLVGTTVNGSVAVGFDWAVPTDKVNSAPTRAGILAHTPSFDTAVWRKASFVLPSSRLQSRTWYELEATEVKDTFDSSPGQVSYISSYAQGGGELWVEYDLVLSGTCTV